MKIFDTRNMPWPSETPRNFETEPATWYDFQKWVSENISYSDDYELELSFFCPIVPSGSILYANKSFFGVFGYGDGRVLFFDQLGYGYDGGTLTATAQANTWYTVRHTSIGTTGRFYFDGVKVQERAKQPERFDLSIVPRSSFDGNIGSIRMTNLMTGKSWHYPTWAEEKRLLTYSNVRTDRGVFEAANSAVTGNIKTALDLRNRPSMTTYIARAYLPSVSTPNYRLGSIISQGVSSNTVHLFSLSMLYDLRTTPEKLMLTMTSMLDNMVVPVSASITLPLACLDSWHVFAGVIDPIAHTLDLFADGLMVRHYYNSAITGPFGTLSTAYNDAVYVRYDPRVDLLSGLQVSHAQIHDYAMTAAEIAAFK